MFLKKLATIGLVGVLAMGQSVDVLAAAAYYLNSGFGGKNSLSEGYHSMTTTFSCSEEQYLKTSMTVSYYYKSSPNRSSTISAYDTNYNTKGKSTYVFKNWTDKDEELNRVYDKYAASGSYRLQPSDSWTIIKYNQGAISDITS